jgi:ubiquinone/menaquinone biosynthesis C-methylase UbiE
MFEWIKSKFTQSLLRIIYEKPAIWKIRSSLLAQADGNILEIGFGSGGNLRFYPDAVTHITAIDPKAGKIPKSRIDVKLFYDSAEKMPFPDSSFDTVITTFTLCSTENPDQVFKEIRRVLKPDGKYLFLEHGQADNEPGFVMQRRFNPIYQRFSHGCSLLRVNTELFESSGFILESYQEFRGAIFPQILGGYLYQGVGIKQAETA